MGANSRKDQKDYIVIDMSTIPVLWLRNRNVIAQDIHLTSTKGKRFTLHVADVKDQDEKRVFLISLKTGIGNGKGVWFTVQSSSGLPVDVIEGAISSYRFSLEQLMASALVFYPEATS